MAHYLNAISPCAVTAFKDAGLEYIALQAENFLENNLLESLDEEVLEELDVIVRDNQLAHYPFARSGRAELLLHEQNPELAQDIEEERQRRVKEMAFRANQREEERKLSSSLKGRVGSLENSSFPSPSTDKQSGKRKSSRNEPFSPELRPKSTQADLMFDMDDDDGAIDSPSVRPQRILDVKKQSDLDSLPTLSGLQRDEKQKTIASSPLSFSPARTTPTQSTLPALPTATTPGKSGSPWAPAALSTAKLDLRKLMGESSGPSALSAGLAAQKAKDAARPQQTKVSQKERKKQQQLQAEQAAKAALLPSAAAWEKSSVDATSSPWKIVSSVKSSLHDDKEKPLATAPSNPKPLLVAEVSSKSIARRTQSPDTRHSGQSRTPSAAPPVRPSPKPKTSHTTSTFSADDPSKPITPHSKSYIKPASKSESTLGLSMADIIDLEKRKQEAVKEAAAKRSLMDIQQEQEFSIWWEEESRRTQEEEARRLAIQKEREENKARGRRGRSGRTARGGRGGATGPSNEATGSTAAAQGETTRQQGQETARGRGNRRGRGRGGAARAAT